MNSCKQVITLPPPINQSTAFTLQSFVQPEKPLLESDSAKKSYGSSTMDREEQSSTSSCFKKPSVAGAIGCGGCWGVFGAVIGGLCCGPWGLFGAAASIPGAKVGHYVLGVCDDKPPSMGIK